LRKTDALIMTGTENGVRSITEVVYQVVDYFTKPGYLMLRMREHDTIVILADVAFARQCA